MLKIQIWMRGTMEYSRDTIPGPTEDQTQEMFEANDILKCIGEGRFQLDEQREQFSKNNFFKSSEELTNLFGQQKQG